MSWTPELIVKYRGHYSSSRLFAKLRKVGRKIGAKVVYAILLLYYTLRDSDLSVRDRTIIIGALGYFILPFDIIPDFMFGGYVEDYAALVFAINHLRGKISDTIRKKARRRVAKLFPDAELTDDTIIPPPFTGLP